MASQRTEARRLSMKVADFADEVSWNELFNGSLWVVYFFLWKGEEQKNNVDQAIQV